MFVICSIIVAVNMGGNISWFTKADTKGKVISESETKYLVDFTDGVKNYQIKDPNAYNEILVDKTECVKVK